MNSDTPAADSAATNPAAAAAAPARADRLSRAAERLGAAVRFATVTRSDYDSIDTAPFTAFQDWLLASYPRTAAALEPRRNGPWSLRFRWRGSDSRAAPLILLAHYDVVPPGDPAAWTRPAFSGELAEGEIWGRGTLDVKINLISAMEAVEYALEQGFAPKRDIWLCFGGDEEVGGSRGAAELGRSLAAEGVSGACLVDEGGVIARGSLGFVKRPVALVGVAEKGFANLRLTAAGSAGHASMPPAHTAAGVLAQALVRVEKHPFPCRLTATMAAFLKGAAPHAPAGLGLLLARSRLFWPLLRLVLAASPKTAAMIRSTQAVTMLAGSDKENVLPASASAIVNVRILPGESVDSVLAHYRRLLRGSACAVELADLKYVNEPLPESPVAGPAWDAVLAALREAEPEALPLPYLVTAGTDTKHYVAVAPNMYRIMGILLEPDQIDLIHSPNERISLENLGRSLRFYDALVRG